MYNNNKVFQRYKSVSGLKKKHLLTKKISLNKCIEKLGYVTKKHYVKKKSIKFRLANNQVQIRVIYPTYYILDLKVKFLQKLLQVQFFKKF